MLPHQNMAFKMKNQEESVNIIVICLYEWDNCKKFAEAQ